MTPSAPKISRREGVLSAASARRPSARAGEHGKGFAAAASEEMAPTSEELSSQAELLQTTVAFFKLEAGLRPPAPAAARPSAAKPAHRTTATPPPAARTGDKPAGTGRGSAQPGTGKNPGFKLELPAPPAGTDSRDRDFEHYIA